MTIDMSQFFQIFFDETEELLAEMEKLLLAVNLSEPDAEELNAIFRAAHSIKGGAGTFGITDLTDITHVLETLLDQIRKGEMVLTPGHVDAFLAAKDVLKMQLDGHRLHTAVDHAAVAATRSRLELLARNFPGFREPVKPRLLAKPQASAHELRRFRIELSASAQGDVDVLGAEIGRLGRLTADGGQAGNAVFMLDTLEDADAIVAICSYVMDPANLKITEHTNWSARDDAAQAVDALGKSSAVTDPMTSPTANPATDYESTAGSDRLESINAQTLAGSWLQTGPYAVALPAKEVAQEYGFSAPFVSRAAPGLALEDMEANGDPGGASCSGVPHERLGRSAPRAPGSEVKRGAVGREPERSTQSSDSTSIRVSVEKVDQLINLVGELVITQAMIEQRTAALHPMDHQRLLDTVTQLTRNTRDLQAAVMTIRMMPMDYVFSRFPRMVHDLAGKLGKKVEFITFGAATELDKGLIERIVDPLTHLVRNSVDHGIEMPAQRVAAGKGETGRLSLSASHQGGNVVIEVTDDGGGLRRNRILAKAQEQGLAISDDMTDAQVWQLIFAPGFSTAEAVTNISGRGVGMDVVKRNITAMGGAVDIRSARGFGTTISISLPLTLAILDGMSVRVGDEVYILPLSYVVESVQPAAADIKIISGQGQVIKVRGEYLPLLALYHVFDTLPQHTDQAPAIVVILESEGYKAALFVDELVGQQQVVVKNLESNYRRVAGISGATILGDGSVALIIDVAALLRVVQQSGNEIF